MATITYTNTLPVNPSPSSVLDPDGPTNPVSATTFEIKNNNGFGADGFIFRLTGSGFTYGGPGGTPDGGTITGFTVLDAFSNVIATCVSGTNGFGNDSLADFWSTLVDGDSGGFFALTALLAESDVVTGSDNPDGLVAFGSANADVVSGGGGNDSITTSLSDGHTLIGGSGDDQIQVADATHLSVHGSAGDGSGGNGETDLLGVAGHCRFDAVSNIDRLQFFFPTLSSQEARFLSNHVAGGGLSTTLFVEEISIGESNTILIERSGSAAVNLQLTGWTFNAEWLAEDHTVRLDFDDGVIANDQVVGSLAADEILGGAGNDLLNGGGGGDILNGGSGNDSMNGGTGADAMAGGSGNDTYIVDNAGDAVAEAPGQGTDTILAPFSLTLGPNLEKLTLTGTAANATGNGLANTLVGNGATNLLDGKAGPDVMQGAGGNDTYIADNSGDKVVENAGQGTDVVQASATFTLGPNVEDLILTGVGAINGVGNGLANTITGNAAANVIAGGAGDDTLVAGSGNDTVRGGLGQDFMLGGLGGDLFDFYTAAEIGKKTTADEVGDFSRAQGDRIDLSGIDAKESKPGDQGFKFIGGKKFKGKEGQLQFKKDELRGDIDGDRKADFALLVDVNKLNSGDLLL